MVKLFLKLLFGPIWKLVGIMLYLFSLLLFLRPDLELSLNLSGIILQIHWYGVAILGLSIWLLVNVWYATRIVYDLHKEIVDADVSIISDSESYLGKQIVYLIAENQGSVNLKDCYANLSKLEYKLINTEQEKQLSKKDYRIIDALIFNNLNKNKLPWPAFSVGIEKVIRASDKGRIDIAAIEKKKLVFLFENEDSNNYSKPGEYYLEVELGGYANGKQIKRKVFRGVLRYVIQNGKHQVYLHPVNIKDKSRRTKRAHDWWDSSR